MQAVPDGRLGYRLTNFNFATKAIPLALEDTHVKYKRLKTVLRIQTLFLWIRILLVTLIWFRILIFNFLWIWI
jgi:hypothetical protein